MIGGDSIPGNSEIKVKLSDKLINVFLTCVNVDTAKINKSSAQVAKTKGEYLYMHFMHIFYAYLYAFYHVFEHKYIQHFCDFSELNYHDRNGSNLQWTKFFSDLNSILFYDIHCNNVFEI